MEVLLLPVDDNGRVRGQQRSQIRRSRLSLCTTFRMAVPPQACGATVGDVGDDLRCNATHWEKRTIDTAQTSGSHATQVIGWQ